MGATAGALEKCLPSFSMKFVSLASSLSLFCKVMHPACVH